MPSLYEAFAMIDDDERRRRMIHHSPTVISESIPDLMAFAATSGSHPGNRHICSHCWALGHTKDRFFKLHPELREKYSHSKGKVVSRTAAIVEIILSYDAPDFTQLQSQIGQLQTQLASLSFPQHSHTRTPTSSVGHTIMLATGTPTAFHVFV
ncbi:hypothetical protein Acr_12g0002880 [Actinidia rufa]|uniref:Uncharacterized protein n=1 Tax=Actinidia rufa TaxID=165716 RepID=A0A7J0FIK5_9ERIC|nr:hypothetical protein Acr_12g0002880 [Actinidia rufa]